MYNYLIRVPSDGEGSSVQKAVISRLETFNKGGKSNNTDSNNEKNISDGYLLFDSGDEMEIRFVLVCEEEVSDEMMKKLNAIFEKNVKAEIISTENCNNERQKRITAAKELKAAFNDNDDYHDCDNDYYYRGKKEPQFVTKNSDQLYEKAGDLAGFTEFRAFLKNYMNYIDQTAEMTANSLYNIVLINKSGVSFDPHIELLYGILAGKGLLTEQVIIKGDIYDAKNSNRETQFVYVIEDEWKTDDREPSSEELLLIAIFGDRVERTTSSTSEKEELFEKIKNSRNIYITTMAQEEYERVSAIDCFRVAFPHVVTIGDISTEERIKTVCSIAGEYGFTFDKKSVKSSQSICTADMDYIDTAVRKAIQKKLVAKDKTFCISISDLELRPGIPKKLSGFDELESMIGLESVKETIKEIVMFLKKRGRNAVPCLHMAFLGNPGTAKTTVARIIAKIFAETGITKKDIFVETQRGGLIGEYLGQTAPKTAKVIGKAMGGVLFIDEAYTLIIDKRDLYGHEAVATLVKIMEDRRDEFVCILAGYPREMNRMLDVNPGLRDRIQFYIDFPDYSGKELVEIFEKLCKENKYKLSDSAKAALKTGFARILAAKSQNFSNGRLVRKVFERAYMKQAQRTSGNIITERDIAVAFAEPDIKAMQESDRATIGFVA